MKFSVMTAKPRSFINNILPTVSSSEGPIIPSLHSSENTITTQLQKCCGLKDLKSTHATMIKNTTHQDSFSMNQFLAACSRLRQMDFAFRAFTQMVDPNIFVYNAVFGGFIQCSTPIKALELYVEMPKAHLRPTRYTFSHLVKASAQVLGVGFGEAVHGQIRKMGFGSELILQTGLIDFYSNLRKIVELRRVFDEMEEGDVFSWNSVIFAHANLRDMDEAKRLFDKMPTKNTVSWNTMIAGYARSGNVEAVASLFDQMPSKNSISWTTMISCYSHNHRFNEAVETFERMKVAGVTPDEVTIATVISACAHLGALQVGRRVHHDAMLNGFELDVYLGSALIDMYAKCGNLERSLIVFFKLEEKNLFCWNSMIDGLAVHGRGWEAINMFYRMKKDLVEPNGISFISVLSACTHSGLVEEGRQIFLSMIRDHSISPQLEHYCCMADLLGRAGLLKEAMDLVSSMEMEPNSVIWGAILGACKLHGNLEIGKVAAEKLLALEPNKSSNYVLLVNMYAEANRWSDAANVRKMMRKRGVQKRSPGCSWIEIDGLVHEFAACDVSHPSCDEICYLLVGLNGQLKLAGYTPEWSFSSL